ncbi:DUF397 domain-containing protein [Streptomyces sp. NPDC048506]|uniref:DUF397 domain-containing protein n=1 Tax=Streptomyces sp. NPDC048506 TaxID=3155028 RepID=UPI00343375DE
MTEHSIPKGTTRRGWRKSSYSDGEGSECLEVLDGHPTGVPVRDSKDPHGPALLFSADAWSAFVGSLKAAD